MKRRVNVVCLFRGHRGSVEPETIGVLPVIGPREAHLVLHVYGRRCRRCGAALSTASAFHRVPQVGDIVSRAVVPNLDALAEALMAWAQAHFRMGHDIVAQRYRPDLAAHVYEARVGRPT